jgi:hypothetical protein
MKTPNKRYRWFKVIAAGGAPWILMSVILVTSGVICTTFWQDKNRIKDDYETKIGMYKDIQKISTDMRDIQYKEMANKDKSIRKLVNLLKTRAYYVKTKNTIIFYEHEGFDMFLVNHVSCPDCKEVYKNIPEYVLSMRCNKCGYPFKVYNPDAHWDDAKAEVKQNEEKTKRPKKRKDKKTGFRGSDNKG